MKNKIIDLQQRTPILPRSAETLATASSVIAASKHNIMEEVSVNGTWKYNSWVEKEIVSLQGNDIVSREYLGKNGRSSLKLTFITTNHRLLFSPVARFTRVTKDTLEWALGTWLPSDQNVLEKLKRILDHIETKDIKRTYQSEGKYGNCFFCAPIITSLFAEEGIPVETVRVESVLNLGTQDKPSYYKDIHYYSVVTIQSQRFIVDLTAEQFERKTGKFELIQQGSTNYGIVMIPYELAVNSNLPYVEESSYLNRWPLPDPKKYAGIDFPNNQIFNKLDLEKIRFPLSNYFSVEPYQIIKLKQEEFELRSLEGNILLENIERVESMHQMLNEQNISIHVHVFHSNSGQAYFLTKTKQYQGEEDPIEVTEQGVFNNTMDISSIFWEQAGKYGNNNV